MVLRAIGTTFRAMLSQFGRIFGILRVFLHVSTRRSASQDDQAGTHTRPNRASTQELPDADAAELRSTNNLQVEKSDDSRRPDQNLCASYSSGRSLLCLVRGRCSAGSNKGVEMFDRFRASTRGLLCFIFACTVVYCVVQPAQSNRANDDRIDEALGLFAGVMAYMTSRYFWEVNKPDCRSTTSCARCKGWGPLELDLSLMML